MASVFLLHHISRKDQPDEDVKFIGVYSSKTRAEDAVKRLSRHPGFSEQRQGFEINEYELDRDHWEEGFITV